MANPNITATASPKTHRVTLDYVEQGQSAQPDVVGGVKVNPDVVRVRKGDTLRFTKGRGPEGAAVRITFSDPGPFSPPNSEGKDQVFTVTSELKRRIAYQCELVSNGKVVATSDAARAAAGGHVEPASGDRGAL